jgi:hypothetical protein
MSASLSQITILQGQIEALHKERDHFNKLLNEFIRRLDAVEKNIKLPEEFASFRDEFLKEREKWRNTKQDNIYTFSRLKTEIDKNENEIEELKVYLDCIKKTLFQKFDDLGDTIKSISDRNSVEFRDNLNRINKIKNDYQEDKEKFRNEFSSTPKSILDSNQQIVKKLEIASLDGQNAVMKINNVELIIKVLERKIEQIMTQIKKLEISSTKE